MQATRDSTSVRSFGDRAYIYVAEAPGASQSEHARAVALYQYYQRMHPTVDPNLLAQRLMHCPPPTAAKPPELEARGLDASHLVYHFSRKFTNTPPRKLTHAKGAPMTLRANQMLNTQILEGFTWGAFQKHL